MSRSRRVDFKYSRKADGEWEVEARCEGIETQRIKGFKSKAEVDEWLNGTGRLGWLRSNGYAK